MLFNTNSSIQHYSFIYTQLNGSMYCNVILIIPYYLVIIVISLHIDGLKERKWLNISIWPIDGTQTCTTTQGKSRPKSNGNERVLHLPQSSKMASPLDSLVLNPGHPFGGKSYSSAEMQLVYSTVPIDWAVWLIAKNIDMTSYN